MREYLEKKLEDYTGRNIIVFVGAESFETRTTINLDEFHIKDRQLTLISGDYELYYNYDYIEQTEQEGKSGVILSSSKTDATVEIYFLGYRTLVTFASEMGYLKDIAGALERLDETKKWLKDTQISLEDKNLWKEVIFDGRHFESYEEWKTHQEQIIKGYWRDIEDEMDTLTSYREEFDEWMNGGSYDWDYEIARILRLKK